MPSELEKLKTKATLRANVEGARRMQAAPRPSLGKLAAAFAPKGPWRPEERSRQAAANIKSTAQAAQRIAREQNVSFEAAAGILRQTSVNLKRARAAFRGVASGRTRRGATQPITVDEAVRSLSRPNVLRGVEGRTELARFVAEEEARRPTTNIRVFRTEEERNRRLLGIRR